MSYCLWISLCRDREDVLWAVEATHSLSGGGNSHAEGELQTWWVQQEKECLSDWDGHRRDCVWGRGRGDLSSAPFVFLMDGSFDLLGLEALFIP